MVVILIVLDESLNVKGCTMALPIRTSIEDVAALNGYFSSKPTGATIKDAKTALGSKQCDGRKLSSMKVVGFLADTEDGRVKATEDGRAFARASPKQRGNIIAKILTTLRPYKAILERVGHRFEETLSASDVAAVWHDHFPEESGQHEDTLNQQTICFFSLAEAAGIGTTIVGRRGAPTRFNFDVEKVRQLILDPSDASHSHNDSTDSDEGSDVEVNASSNAEVVRQTTNIENTGRKKLGQAIFIAHGKEKKPLDQLKSILNEFKVPYRVCVDEPNLGRPISDKVRETMEECNCAIIIFSADEELKTSEGKTIWRPSENVVHELGAAGYLYGKKIVILREDKVSFPSNFRDLGSITFEKDQLEAQAMKVLKELIGFGIVKMTT